VGCFLRVLQFPPPINLTPPPPDIAEILLKVEFNIPDPPSPPSIFRVRVKGASI